MKIKLGTKVKDELTGLTGIAMARTEYLHGCVSVGILPSGLDDKGLPKNWVWVDEPRLIKNSDATTGGPQPNAPER